MKKLFVICFILTACYYHGQAQDHQNDWFYNPFNKQSAHHRSIGTGAVYADEDHPAVATWLRYGKPIDINVGMFGLYMGKAEPGGRVLAVGKAPRIIAGGKGLPVTTRFPVNEYYVNYNNFPGDGHYLIYEPDKKIAHQFSGFLFQEGGQPMASFYTPMSMQGLGHGTKLGDYTGSYAGGLTHPFGVLRGWELKKTGRPIGHALHMAIYNSSTRPLLAREVWWPATHMDGVAYRDATRNIGTIPYGSLWAIPPVSMGGPDLDTLGLSEIGMRLAECMRDYGIYVLDEGGNVTIRGDQDCAPYITEIKDAGAKLWSHLRMVTNSVPENGKVKFNVGDKVLQPTGGPNKQVVPGDFPAGGGVPLAPNTAIDAVYKKE